MFRWCLVSKASFLLAPCVRRCVGIKPGILLNDYPWVLEYLRVGVLNRRMDMQVLLSISTSSPPSPVLPCPQSGSKWQWS